MSAVPHASAQPAYPVKTVQMVVPYTAGGGADVVMRAVAQRLAEAWSKNVIVDNRAGASGMIGTELVAKAEPDGYTLLGHTSSYPATAAIREKLPFDPARSIVPVASVAKTPLVLVVHPSLPAKSVKELVALAKVNPGKLNYSSAGTGGNNHFAASLFATAAGITLTHIPYKGVAEAAISVMSGEVELLFASSPAVSPQVKSGRLRALGVTSLEPSNLLPGLPAIAQSGVPGYSYELWWAIFAPAGIAAERRNFIAAAITHMLASADMKKFLSEQSCEPWVITGAPLNDLLPKEIERYKKAAKAAGMQAQ
ncbi:MAG: tripartite tricarboxylate transporter substrate binding protein [Betaproteobacteria bacterium]|nr:tripartite tricarboxylate transporter substrate binding protein [Betaproteobacteria bacterium]